MRRGLLLALALSLASLILSACSTNGAPRVDRFDASARTVTTGTSVTLSWSVTGDGPMTVSIGPGVGTVAGQGTVTVNPSQTTTYTLSATGPMGATSAAVTVDVTAAPTSDPFNLTLDFVSSISSSQRAAFDAAASRWSQIVTAGLPDTYASIPAGSCPSAPGSGAVFPASSISQTIDDIRIDVWVGPIDGAGGILGQGGPCIVRGGDGLTLYGVMQFDAADLSYLEQNNLLESTVLHEMGHVLGIGTLWNWSGRALLTGAGTSNPRFVGTNAVREWQALGGSGDVPVENCLDASGNPIQGCGQGTEDGHWREAVFGNELMTGYLDPTSDPLSRVTVGSLQDLGYTVDYAEADAYALPVGVTALSVTAAPRGTFLLTTPKGTAP